MTFYETIKIDKFVESFSTGHWEERSKDEACSINELFLKPAKLIEPN